MTTNRNQPPYGHPERGGSGQSSLWTMLGKLGIGGGDISPLEALQRNEARAQYKLDRVKWGRVSTLITPANAGLNIMQTFRALEAKRKYEEGLGRPGIEPAVLAMRRVNERHQGRIEQLVRDAGASSGLSNIDREGNRNYVEAGKVVSELGPEDLPDYSGAPEMVVADVTLLSSVSQSYGPGMRGGREVGERSDYFVFTVPRPQEAS